MQFIFLHCSIPLLSSLIAISIIVFFFCYGKKSKFFPDYGSAVPVFEVLKSFAKICPINGSNKWKLVSYEYGSHRCWIKKYLLPGMRKNVDLCGSSTILNSSSVNVGSLIADLTKWPEWNPLYSSQYIVKSFHDKQLKRDHYMEAEQIVSIVRESNKIQSHTSMYRFHDFYENKVGWILFWHVKKLEFMFFLMQPVRNKNENPQCLLTHIIGTHENCNSSSASVVLQRLRNIKDLLCLSSLTFVPLKFSSAQAEVDEPSSENQPSSAISHESFFSLPATRARKRDVRHTVFILVPSASPSHWLWKKNMEFKLGVKNMDSVLLKSKIAKVQLEQKQNDSIPQHFLRRTASDVGMKSQILIDLSKCSEIQDIPNSIPEFKNEIQSSGGKILKDQKQSSDTTSEDSEAKGNSNVMFQVKIKERFPRVKLRSLSETALNKPELSSHSSQAQYNDECIKKLQNIDENAEDKLLAIDDHDEKEIFNSSVSDFEVIENTEYSENRIAGFITQGNYGASELQAEVLLASQIEHSLNSGGFHSGGWVFHSMYKGMSVLYKSTSSQFLEISSFLCQTELPVSPKDVWKFVKNPQFRFICDETVKSVEVLEKISSSQKLIHTYHEVNGIIRKELMDFCLLQTEREELNKYYSCFYSIEHDKCPFMNSVTRGFFRPSGWIVGKVDNDPKKSKVTYLIQILINSPDSMFIQELSTLVPQSLHNLKNYITVKPM